VEASFDRNELLTQISRLERRFSGQFAIAASNLATGERLAVNADEIYPTASTIKIPLLVEVFRRAQAGLLSMDERIVVTGADHVGGSGILARLEDGIRLTIRDLATLMVVVSDNTATNILIARIGGPGAVNETMRHLGFDTITLHGPLDLSALRDDIRRFGEASPSDLERLIAELARGNIIDAETSAQILEIMGKQQYLDQVPRYLRVDPFIARTPCVDEPVRVACKTGFARQGVRVDMGLISLSTNTKITYCIASEKSEDRSFSPEHEGAVIHGLLGRLLVEHWWANPQESPPVLATPYLALLAED
jgi:beta-lactamase class A